MHFPTQDYIRRKIDDQLTKFFTFFPNVTVKPAATTVLHSICVFDLSEILHFECVFFEIFLRKH